ncbi:MAG: galactose mutarotase [Streptococcaceae bacterium]|jgi:aldose 1-epimerase|nr:galactose mutarotase [Streptococcaceae bacterium]
MIQLKQEPFGEAQLYRLTNGAGNYIELSNFGARIVSFVVGNRQMVLGFDRFLDYQITPHIGATIGRVAGRIKDGTANISGKDYQFSKNHPAGFTLHGGTPGFESRYFEVVETKIEEHFGQITFRYVSKAFEHGFPGELTVDVTHRFDEETRWTVIFDATTTADTLFNPTNHVYFNLTGDVGQTIFDHTLQLSSDEYAVLAANGLPTGRKASVALSDFDFRTPSKLRKVEKSHDVQIRQFDGLDHPFFLTEPSSAGHLVSPDGKFELTIQTNQSAVVVFTMNFGQEKLNFRGKQMVNHAGITFETQSAPGSERLPDFGHIVLKKWEAYHAGTIYQIKER